MVVVMRQVLHVFGALPHRFPEIDNALLNAVDQYVGSVCPFLYYCGYNTMNHNVNTYANCETLRCTQAG